MAKNLRAKIPASDTLVVCDVREDVTRQFVEEIRAEKSSSGAAPGPVRRVEVAANAREVAEKSVCISITIFARH